jgi:DNA-binding IclR family transcriptional regulator
MADSNRSQTLDRGLKALSFIAKCNTAPTIDELAENLGLGRTVTYRIVRTLEDHNLVSRAEDGRLRPGSHLATLARQIRGDLQSAAHGVMTRLSNELGMTSFLVVSDNADAITIQSVEPSTVDAHIVYRPGFRHPISQGAPGIALLSAEPPMPNERMEVSIARERGWASSVSEVLPGMISVAAPIKPVGSSSPSALAIVHLAAGLASPELISARVVIAAKTIEEILSQ